MPRLVCRTCRREVWATAPLEALFADERRCPKCGTSFTPELREGNRRMTDRRADDSGPESRVGESAPDTRPSEERRVGERRERPRRRSDRDLFQRDGSSWED